MSLINPSYILTKQGDRCAIWSDNPEKQNYTTVNVNDRYSFDPESTPTRIFSYDEVVAKASSYEEAFKEAYKYENHYKFIEYVGPYIQKTMDLQFNPSDLSVAHGDKCYGYRDVWEKAGIPFNHGALVYLLTHMNPYSQQVRQTDSGWVPVEDWVIDFYKKVNLLQYINEANKGY